MPKKRSVSRTNQQSEWRDLIYGVMLLIVVAIMPLVVRFAVIMPPPELFAMYGREYYFDFFFQYKGWALGVPATVILVYTIADWLMSETTAPTFRELLESPPIVASSIFLVMSLISTIFSSYRHTSFHGTVDRGEGMLILIAYFIVFFAAMYFTRTAGHAKVLLYGFAFSSFIMGVIALTQFLQQDFFLTSIGDRLIMSRAWRAHIAENSQHYGDVIEGRFTFAYGTLYNPNTLGKYAAMAAPILLACALAFDDWKRNSIIVRVGFFLSGVLMLVAVFGSRSLAGFLAVAAAGGITAVTLVSRFVYQIVQNRAHESDNDSQSSTGISWVVAGLVLVILGIGLYFVPPVNDRVNLALERASEAVLAEPELANDIVFDNNHMTLILSEQEQFSIIVSPNAFAEGTPFTDSPWELYDPSGQPIPVNNRVTHRDTEGLVATYYYDVPGHGRVALMRFFHFFIFRDMAFTIYEGRLYALSPVSDLIDMSVTVPTIGFQGREMWGSARGYIWSRTFPLLPSRIIIGSGPDTFVQVFPQDDVIAKSFFLPSPYTPVDKAHNVFLQAWVNTGGISAIALLFLFVYYLFTAFVATVKSKMREGVFLFGLRFGLLAGIGAFTVASLSTDSTIGSSGVFFVLLGIGYGINLLVKRIEKEDVV